MSPDVQHHKAVQEFVELLLPTSDTILKNVRDCMLKVTEDGYTLPINSVGAVVALVAYRVVQSLQEVLRGPDGEALQHGDITGVFVDSITNLISCDFGLLTMTMNHTQMEFLRSLTYEHRDNDMAKLLLKMFEHADAVWAAMQQRRAEVEKICREAKQAQLQ
jgi:hypothetical protein